MSKNSYGYIYKTENKLNGKIYIGQHSYSCKRKAIYRGSGTALHNAMRKHGRSNFQVSIIVNVDTKEQLNEFERFFIAKYREIIGQENMYNICDGGECGPPHMLGKKHPEDRKKKLSEKMKGWKLGNHTTESYKKSGNAHKELWKNEEYRQRMSEAHKGKPGYWKGKKLSEEHRAKCKFGRLGKSSWNKGIPMSDDTKKKFQTGEHAKKISEAITLWHKKRKELNHV